MINSLKSWIITICTAVFFITAVEMILPNNSMKKYAKFVLGLILMTVLIKPVILIFDKKYDLSVYANNAAMSFQSNSSYDEFEKYKDDNAKNTTYIFKKNLDELCEKYLKQEYPENEYDVDCSIAYDNVHQVMEIRGVDVYVSQGKIQPVKKVVINNRNNTNDDKTIDRKTEDKIIDLLNTKLEISKDVIKVLKK